MEVTADNNKTNTEVQNSTDKDERTDYKVLYEATLAERNSEREKNKQLETSLNEYKKKESDAEAERRKNLPPEERSAEEIDERDRTIEALTARLNRNELEKVFASDGYKEKDYSKIVDLISSNDLTDKSKTFEHRLLVAKEILAFVKSEKEKFSESARVEGIQKGIQYFGGEGANADSSFKQWQNAREKNENKGKVKL